MNAIAGGGSFVTFPAMVAAGLPPVIANVSSTVALFPGTMASTLAYRRDFASIERVARRAPCCRSPWRAASWRGVCCSPPRRGCSMRSIPFLLLLATLTFAFGARAGLALRRVVPVGPGAVLPMQFLVSIYGGYFGGAVGLMMMATWSLLTANADLKAMAPARVLLVSAANGAAVLWFIGAGAVRWPETLAMLSASILGGYLARG